MRQRDENKISALSKAAIDLVAEQGIINLSINKMAKRAEYRLLRHMFIMTIKQIY
ncbi:hypothetical protein ABU186_00365 [Weissella paramesenteroides]